MPQRREQRGPCPLPPPARHPSRALSCPSRPPCPSNKALVSFAPGSPSSVPFHHAQPAKLAPNLTLEAQKELHRPTTPTSKQTAVPVDYDTSFAPLLLAARQKLVASFASQPPAARQKFAVSVASSQRRHFESAQRRAASLLWLLQLLPWPAPSLRQPLCASPCMQPQRALGTTGLPHHSRAPTRTSTRHAAAWPRWLTPPRRIATVVVIRAHVHLSTSKAQSEECPVMLSLGWSLRVVTRD